MMQGNFTNTLSKDTAIDTAQFGPALYSPFSYTLPLGEPTMIKQAAPQHPHGLTKLQHRLLYESDSDGSFDFSFSSPSSVGSTSEYSDVGYQSSTRSRNRSSGLSRQGGGSHGPGSRSGSISSVLGSSIAIQRVMMGTNPSSRGSQRQSVRAIASAFEAVSATSTVRAPALKTGSQLGRVDEQSVPSRNVQASKEDQLRSASQSSSSLFSRSQDSSMSRAAEANGTGPARLKISKQSFQGPKSAPAATTTQSSQRATSPTDARSDSTRAEPHFVFPPRIGNSNRRPHDDNARAQVRSFVSLDGQPDDDEPAFDIVLSPSHKRSVVLPFGVAALRQHLHDTPRASSSRSPSTFGSPPLPSSRSAASRDSMESSYSLDSLSGHPFSLQLAGEDELELRGSLAASIHDAYDSDKVAVVLSGGGGDEFITQDETSHQHSHLQPSTLAADAAVASARGSTLQPLLLSTSRPSSSSSSSTTTLTPRAPPAAAAASMRVNEDTCFPLPPFADMAKATGKGPVSFAAPVDGKAAFEPRGLTLGATPKHAADPAAVAELKQQAAELLASIRSLSDQLETSIPATHRLPGSAYRPASALGDSATSSATTSNGGASTASFVAVDESYSDVWRLMDAWYWSTFEVGPRSPSML